MERMKSGEWLVGFGALSISMLVVFFVACTVTVDGQESAESLEAIQQDGAGGTATTTLITYDLQQGSLGGMAVGGGYNGATDATIYAAFATTNYGSTDTCTVDGGSTERACVFRWQMPPPSTATVTAASIILTLDNGTAGNFSVYQLLKAWDEGLVTWNAPNNLQSWGLPGAKEIMGITPDRAGGVLGTLTGGVGQRTINLNATGLSVVQGWVTSSANNRGVIIAGSSTDGVHIRSSEHVTITSRPILRVTYQL